MQNQCELSANQCKIRATKWMTHNVSIKWFAMDTHHHHPRLAPPAQPDSSQPPHQISAMTTHSATEALSDTGHFCITTLLWRPLIGQRHHGSLANDWRLLMLLPLLGLILLAGRYPVCGQEQQQPARRMPSWMMAHHHSGR